MSDIVERLKAVPQRVKEGFLIFWSHDYPLCREAAAEILRLRAENEKLRETCQNIKIMFETKWSWSSQHKIDIACRDIAAALKETGDE